MKPAILLAIAIVVLSSLPVVSRRNNAEAQENSVHSAKNLAFAIRLANAQLTGKLDPAYAKTGETITATTTEKILIPNGFEIPRGSRLMGRITEIRHDTGPALHVNIAFDRAELPSGQSISIHLDSGSQLVLGGTR